VNNPFRFSLEYFDEETELVYYNFRYYSPDLGRWLNRDPLGESGGFNLYAIAANNIINRWDYLGMCDPSQMFTPEGQAEMETMKAFAGEGVDIDGEALVDSWFAQSESWTGTWEDILTGNLEAKDLAENYDDSALGQTQDDNGLGYYGTRAALGTATAAIVAAVAVGSMEFFAFGNESLAEFSLNTGTSYIKILSRTLQKGYRIDKADPHKPFTHQHFWEW